MSVLNAIPNFSNGGQAAKPSVKSQGNDKSSTPDTSFASLVSQDPQTERTDVSAAQDHEQAKSRDQDDTSSNQQNDNNKSSTSDSVSQSDISQSQEAAASASVAVAEADIVDPIAQLMAAAAVLAQAAQATTAAPVAETTAAGTDTKTDDKPVEEHKDQQTDDSTAAAIYATLTQPGMSVATVMPGDARQETPVAQNNNVKQAVQQTEAAPMQADTDSDKDGPSVNLSSQVGQIGLKRDSFTMDKMQAVAFKAQPFVKIQGTSLLAQNELPALVTAGLGGQKVTTADALYAAGAAKMAEAAAPAPVTVDVNSLQTQIRDVLRVAIRDRNRSAELTLEPPDWGRLNIKIQVNRSEVNLTFTASNDKVKEALEGSAAELRKTLANQGLNLGQLNVGLSQQQGGRGNGENQDFIAMEDSEKIQKARNPALSRISKWASSSSATVDRVV